LIWIERFSKKAGCRIEGLNEGSIPVVGGCEKQVDFTDPPTSNNKNQQKKKLLGGELLQQK